MEYKWQTLLQIYYYCIRIEGDKSNLQQFCYVFRQGCMVRKAKKV